MKLEFDKIPVKHLERFNGGEKELAANMFVDENNKILRGLLVPGASIGYHQHATSSEVFYIISGCGKVICNPTDSGIENGATERLAAGDCHYCPKGGFHTLINDGDEDLVFFAVVPQQ